MRAERWAQPPVPGDRAPGRIARARVSAPFQASLHADRTERLRTCGPPPPTPAVTPRAPSPTHPLPAPRTHRRRRSSSSGRAPTPARCARARRRRQRTRDRRSTPRAPPERHFEISDGNSTRKCARKKRADAPARARAGVQPRGCLARRRWGRDCKACEGTRDAPGRPGEAAERPLRRSSPARSTSHARAFFFSSAFSASGFCCCCVCRRPRLRGDRRPRRHRRRRRRRRRGAPHRRLSPLLAPQQDCVLPTTETPA